eukprot:6199758-Pleurochrysis_carterae.AAC.6
MCAIATVRVHAHARSQTHALMTARAHDYARTERACVRTTVRVEVHALGHACGCRHVVERLQVRMALAGAEK